VDAIKFTLKKETKKEPVAAIAETEADVVSAVPGNALTPQELREMLAKSRDAEDDDCLMCGS
jgi:ribonucleoside-diphosphate reductase alpha chain